MGLQESHVQNSIGKSVTPFVAASCSVSKHSPVQAGQPEYAQGLTCVLRRWNLNDDQAKRAMRGSISGRISATACHRGAFMACILPVRSLKRIRSQVHL